MIAHVRTTTVATIGQQFNSVERDMIRAGFDNLIQGRIDWAARRRQVGTLAPEETCVFLQQGHTNYWQR